MAKPIIAIVGLGFIGSSIGLALKQAGGNFEIVGHDREPSASGQAKKINAVDRTSWNLINATEAADLVILAIPLSAIEDVLKAIGPYLKPGCLVIDTCSIKRPVLEWADQHLPETVSFVGGDPIVQALAGVEMGEPTPSAALFKNGMFCLCPSPRTKPEAVQLAADLAATLGAQPYFLDAAEHDGLLAGVEHLPSLLSAALLLTLTERPSWREMRKVAGGDFQRATYLPAGTSAALRRAVLSNSDNLVRWLDALIERLEGLRSAIVESGEDELEKQFESAIDQRARWIADRARGFAGEDLPPRTEVPSYWKTMFGFGGSFFRRKEIEDAGKEPKKGR